MEERVYLAHSSRLASIKEDRSREEFYHIQRQEQRETILLCMFDCAYSQLAHEILPPTFKVSLPTSINNLESPLKSKPQANVI